MTDILMNLPEEGFFFITKHTLEGGVPMIYFAVQKDGTGDTVSVRINPQEVELNIPTLNSILELLTGNWHKEYDQKVAPDVMDWQKYSTPVTAQPKSTRGELV